MQKDSTTEVVIIGVVHEIYKDQVLAFITQYNPDVIGVEIRPEDMNEAKEYLLENYPSEMVECVFEISSSKEVFGFDWLGGNIEGKRLSREFWKNESIKKLYRQYENDTTYAMERELLQVIQNKRDELIEKSTLITLNNGTDDILAELYYKQFFKILEKTPYEEWASFWQERDRHIDKNIINIIENHPGKRIIFVMGSDHRYLAMKAIEEYFSDSIKLVKYLE